MDSPTRFDTHHSPVPPVPMPRTRTQILAPGVKPVNAAWRTCHPQPTPPVPVAPSTLRITASTCGSMALAVALSAQNNQTRQSRAPAISMAAGPKFVLGQVAYPVVLGWSFVMIFPFLSHDRDDVRLRLDNNGMPAGLIRFESGGNGLGDADSIAVQVIVDIA